MKSHKKRLEELYETLTGGQLIFIDDNGDWCGWHDEYVNWLCNKIEDLENQLDNSSGLIIPLNRNKNGATYQVVFKDNVEVKYVGDSVRGRVLGVEVVRKGKL